MHKGDYFMNAATFRLGRETPMHIILLKCRLLNLHFDLHMMYTYTYSALTVHTYMVKNTIHTYIHTHIQYVYIILHPVCMRSCNYCHVLHS